MHGLTKIAPLPAAGQRALVPEQQDTEEDREIPPKAVETIDFDKGTWPNHDPQVPQIIPAQPVKIRVGAHHIGITK